jgi:carboxypeptidase family protein
MISAAKYAAWCGVALVAALLMATTPSAQLQSGNLYGTVVDEQGSPLPGVVVKLAGGGAPQTQVTDAQGQFRFLSLAPGQYRLTCELEGFATREYPNVNINVGRNTTIEVTLSAAVEDVTAVTTAPEPSDSRAVAHDIVIASRV